MPDMLLLPAHLGFLHAGFIRDGSPPRIPLLQALCSVALEEALCKARTICVKKL